MSASKIRNRLYKDPDVGELARDADDSFRALPVSAIVSVQTVYREPFTLAMPSTLGSQFMPQIVRCDRARDATTSTNIVVPTGTSWTGVGSSARIDRIGGLTIGTKYNLTFMVVG